MQLRYGRWVLLVTALGLTTFWGIAARNGTADDVEVKVKIPAKIKAAIKAKWPKAEIEEITVEEEDGKIVFEFELEEEDGKTEREWTATFSADGKLLETEEEIKLADVPKVVLEALQKKYPLVKKPAVEKITEGEGDSAKVFYELEFSMEVKIDATGKIVEEEEEVDRDDDD